MEVLLEDDDRPSILLIEFEDQAKPKATDIYFARAKRIEDFA